MSIPPAELWSVDFEFRCPAGELPHVVCMVAMEFYSGRKISMWRDELLKLNRAPFDTENTIAYGFYASAEMSCFLQLGWPMPRNLLDLFVEHKLSINGIPAPPKEKRKRAAITGKSQKSEGRASLLGALAIRGLAHIDADDKEERRELIMTEANPTPEQKQLILEYCASDVVATEALLRYMAEHGEIDWPRALWRGEYIKAVGRIERCGAPIDVQLHGRLSRNWPTIISNMIASVNQTFNVFEDDTFKEDKFAQYVVDNDLPWPLLPSGALDLETDTFDDMCRYHPQLRPLYEVRSSLGKMRLTGLAVGPDGRNRCLLSVFQAVTGRNQPSNSKFIFGPARWMRGLIKPKPGEAVAYLDWKSQEIAVAAALSGDERLLRAYQTGDVYMAFAIDAGLAPRGATKDTHPQIRDICKTIVLGIGYGMGGDSLAVRSGLTKTDARNLIGMHKYAYKDFWRWTENSTANGLFTHRMFIKSGWRRWICDNPNIRSMQNWPIQSTAAEMMRTAAVAATESGLLIGAPVHDAFLLTGRAKTIERDAAALQDIMSKTGDVVIGIPVPAEVKFVFATGELPERMVSPKLRDGTSKDDTWTNGARLCG